MEAISPPVDSNNSSRREAVLPLHLGLIQKPHRLPGLTSLKFRDLRIRAVQLRQVERLRMSSLKKICKMKLELDRVSKQI